MTEPAISFDYKIRIWAMLFICACLLLFAAGFAFMASVNTSGTTEIITLSPAALTNFYWGISLLFVVSTAVAVRLIFNQRKLQKQIVITDSGITLPRRPLSSRTVTIPFADVTHLERVANRGIAFISIRYTDGAIAIPESHLSPNDYAEIYTQIAQRCPHIPI